MPSETVITARNAHGNEIYFQQASLPSIEVVKAYEEFHKGAAKIILEMAVAEQNTELDSRRIGMRLEFVTRVLGMVFAFLLTAGLIVAGSFLLYFDHTLAGGLSLFSGLISIVGCIATGGKKR